MTDRPILFSGPMVRALLDGRKTQTRRVLKPQPFEHEGQWFVEYPGLDGGGLGIHDTEAAAVAEWMPFIKPRIRFARGDRLWVRETWAVAPIYDGVRPREINPGGKPRWCGIRYAATDARKGIKDRPSIFMPRWASRLTLQVTDVRVQRVQEISEDDAWAEGCKPGDLDDNGNPFPAEEPHPKGGWIGWDYARDWFADLWDGLNGPRGYGWDANPWTVAVTFTVHRQNIDQMETGNG
ncbi:hypothetical protein [Palleronia sp.]|uniref:hypothetical protein n=1 Tax=Palleronia sp. TaxID=1940284 RepID=UPI0035C8481F